VEGVLYCGRGWIGGLNLERKALPVEVGVRVGGGVVWGGGGGGGALKG